MHQAPACSASGATGRAGAVLYVMDSIAYRLVALLRLAANYAQFSLTPLEASLPLAAFHRAARIALLSDRRLRGYLTFIRKLRPLRAELHM